MKKTILISSIALAALVTLASCKKEQASTMQFTATIEQAEKTTITVGDNTATVNWTVGDEMRIFDNNYGSAKLQALSSGVTTTLDLQSEDYYGFDEESAPFTAIYPYSAASSSDKVHLPATQEYAGNEVHAPMIAQGNSTNLLFKNLCGILVLNLQSTGYTLRSITVSATGTKGTGDNIQSVYPCGYYTVDYNDGAPMLTFDANGGNTVVLDCGEGVDISTATNFYIYLPPARYDALTFTLITTNGGVCVKTFSSTESGSPFVVNRNQYNLLSFANLTFSSPVAADDLHTPLTFEAKEANSSVTFTAADMTPAPALQYSTDGTTWTDYTSGTAITLANVGDKISFRGDNTTMASEYNVYSQFACTGQCYLYGNIMSLLDATDYATATTLTHQYSFGYLFENNTAIYNHESRNLILPATRVSSYGYSCMFRGCTHLTTAPALPATTLGWACYQYMFSGCSGLTSAPALPATMLSYWCYECMFMDCTSLQMAPALPATTLAKMCYYSLFRGCTALTTAPALPATMLAEDCYHCMFMDCTSLQTAPVLPATTLAEDCYASMFWGCTSLTSAPALPATTLAKWCYNFMFRNCTSLNSVKCLATDISAPDCTRDWLKGVSSTGTFTKAASMTDWGTGDSGIPSGWTVVNE